MAEALPYHRQYARDFLADTAGLSTAAIALYAVAREVCWAEGAIPRDLVSLALRCHMPVISARKLWPQVERHFEDSPEGWRHTRLEGERGEIEAEIQARSGHARSAAEARWGKPKQSSGNARAYSEHNSGSPQAMPENSPGNANHHQEAEKTLGVFQSTERENLKVSTTFDDDDDKPPKTKAELTALVKRVYGQTPVRKTWDKVEAELAVRGVPMKEYCEQIAPHIARNGLTNPEGFLLTFARQFASRTQRPGMARAGDSIPQIPTEQRYACCNGSGKTDDGYCTCAVGGTLRELERRQAEATL